MNWLDLRKNAFTKLVFKIGDVIKWFPDETENQILVQLSRFVKSGQLNQPRKGLYLLGEHQIDNPFLLANAICEPSYISMETALNYYGLIPDIPSAITSVTTRKTKTYENDYGKFIYRSIKPELFFGFEFIGYNIALPEKAILDYLQLNPHIDGLDNLRFRNIENI